jgi:hypothetical protein
VLQRESDVLIHCEVLKRSECVSSMGKREDLFSISYSVAACSVRLLQARSPRKLDCCVLRHVPGLMTKT